MSVRAHDSKGGAASRTGKVSGYPKSIARALQLVRDDVRWLEDVYTHDTKDPVWLKDAGAQGWLVIMRDKKILTRPGERAALLDNNVGAFYLTRRFVAEEHTNSYFAGCTDYRFNRAAVLALEAFRLMNAGLFWYPGNDDGAELVPALLRKAAEEYERALREEVDI